MDWNDLISKTDLRTYIVNNGFKFIKKESTRTWLYYQNADLKQTILVYFHQKTNTFHYHNPENKKDAGSVVNFIMNRIHGTLIAGNYNKTDYPKAALILRNFLNIPDDKKIQPSNYEKNSTTVDHDKFDLNLYSYEHLKNYQFLALRNISTQTLKNPLFFNRIIEIISFPLYSNDNIVGIKTLKNPLTAFPLYYNNNIVGAQVCKTSEKNLLKYSNREDGLWISNIFNHTTHLVVCEEAIDALSHHQLFNDYNKFSYVSTTGRPSAKHYQIIIDLATQKNISSICLANDNDKYGQLFNLHFILNHLGNAENIFLEWQNKVKISLVINTSAFNPTILNKLYSALSEFNTLEKNIDSTDFFIKSIPAENTIKIIFPFLPKHIYALSLQLISHFISNAITLSIDLPKAKDWNEDL